MGIFAISSGAILVRLATDAAENNSLGFSLVMSASRLGFAALLLSPHWIRNPWRQVPAQALRSAIIAGVFLALHFPAWFLSLTYTSIAASTTLVTTSPIWVALLSWLWLKEPISKQTGLGIIVALSGSLLIATAGNPGTLDGQNILLGNSLALFGAIAVSFYLVLGRQSQRQGLTTANYITVAYTSAAILLFPLPFLFGTDYGGYPSEVYLYLILMAVIPQLIGHTSLNWSMNQTSPHLVSLAILLEPVGSSLLGFLLFQEVPSAAVVLGGGVILTGVAITVLSFQTRG